MTVHGRYCNLKPLMRAGTAAPLPALLLSALVLPSPAARLLPSPWLVTAWQGMEGRVGRAERKGSRK
ncbi:unnamed protein product [Closterium sp. NIES-64]|nr:unnamed protein product [Closterium sp. NIES-64]